MKTFGLAVSIPPNNPMRYPPIAEAVITGAFVSGPLMVVVAVASMLGFRSRHFSNR
jgi:hypothetical protein